MRAALTHSKHKRDDCLPGIDFQREEEKQQCVFHRAQPGFASAPNVPLPHEHWALARSDSGGPRLGTGHTPRVAGVFVEPRQGPQGTRTLVQASLGEHEAPLYVVEVAGSGIASFALEHSYFR
jgi:hypothetical protein